MVTIISAAPAATSTAISASMTLIAVLTLIVLLIQKEIASGLESAHAKQLSRALNVAIAPLLVIFAVNFIIRIVGLLH